MPHTLIVELSGPGDCPLTRRVMPRNAVYLIASASHANAAILCRTALFSDAGRPLITTFLASFARSRTTFG